jgi:hypothetical protein
MAAISRRTEQAVLDAIGLPVVIEADGPRLVITGLVPSDEARQAVLDLVREDFNGRELVDNLTVTDALPEETGGLDLSLEDAGGLTGATAGLEDEDEAIEAGDFTDQQTVHSPDEAAGPSASLYDDVVSEGDRVYTPPIDPVGTNREVIGGLQASSLDSIEIERSALDGAIGDEAIRDAVLRELREDSATTDLLLDVAVEGGVVTIRGRVSWLDDAENAEEVGARVPGVIEVLDETEVEQLEAR